MQLRIILAVPILLVVCSLSTVAADSGDRRGGKRSELGRELNNLKLTLHYWLQGPCFIVALPVLVIAVKLIFDARRRRKLESELESHLVALRSDLESRFVTTPDDSSLRYGKSVVAEIDLDPWAASEDLKALGQALLHWHQQHPEISEIIGSNELSNGDLPPFLGGFPICPDRHPGTGETHLIGPRPVVIRSEALIDEGAETARQAIARSLEACLPKTIVRRISVGEAFRMP